MAGESIGLTASPNSGYQVSNWSGTNNNSSTSNTNTLTMPSNPTTVTVNYGLICYTLTLGHSGQGSNPVASPTNSSGCATGTYSSGQLINLTGASPTAGWQISGWSGTSNNASTNPTNSLTMPGNSTEADVNYTQVCYVLTLTHSGQGSDPVASPLKSSACSTNGQYVSGESISSAEQFPPAATKSVAEWHVQ